MIIKVVSGPKGFFYVIAEAGVSFTISIESDIDKKIKLYNIDFWTVIADIFLTFGIFDTLL